MFVNPLQTRGGLTILLVGALASGCASAAERREAAGAAAITAASATAHPPFSTEEQERIEEHVFGGLPSTEHVLVRQGYVISYNPDKRTPNWVAYHVVPEYRQTPAREGVFASFRVDPDIEGEAKDSEYNGLFRSRGYARGHLAPYGVMGGDRDDDGKFAEEDEFDLLTIKQANYMSNIAPQHHEGFNGTKSVNRQQVPGLWYELERWIQDDLVRDGGGEAWVFAGCIFGPSQHEKVGPNHDIWVPPMFYKIVITDWPEGARPDGVNHPLVLAYLFPHQRVRHGELDAFLTSVNVIEALAGVDFFQDRDDEDQLEDVDTWEWVQVLYEQD